MVDVGDLRYLFESWNSPSNFFMFERNIRAIAKAMLKLEILYSMRYSETQEAAI